MYLEQEEGRNEMLVENAPDVTGEVIPADRVDEDEDAPEVEEPEEADGDDAGPLLAAPGSSSHRITYNWTVRLGWFEERQSAEIRFRYFDTKMNELTDRVPEIDQTFEGDKWEYIAAEPYMAAIHGS